MTLHSGLNRLLAVMLALVGGSMLAGCGSALPTSGVTPLLAADVEAAPPVLPVVAPPSAAVPPAGDDTLLPPPANEQELNARAKSAFERVGKALGREGVYKTPGVYVVTVPRDDVALFIEGMEVPTAAGIESVFHFYYCPCGKTCVVGQFCVLDYEVNDVIDALRAARIEIASVAPMLLHARNAPVLVRFFAEGKPEPIAGAIKEGLRWTGKERSPKVEFKKAD